MSPTMACPRCWGAKLEPDESGAPCRLCDGLGVRPDAQLSPHFRLSELLRSDTATRRGIPNDPTPEHVEHLRELAELLEQVRAHFAVPLHVSSGLRLPALNAAIGGSPTSAHPWGYAADFHPGSPVTLRAVVEYVAASALAFDQVIYEGTWVHLGVRSPTGAQRRQALQMFGGDYASFDPHDPRVAA